MALLLFFLRRRGELGIRVAAAHVDHGIRGKAAHEDAAFVADFCAHHGVPFFLFDAAGQGVNIPEQPSEDWARQLRYSWLDELAKREQAQIATAHTANDQAETLLLRLARGAGVHGMGGIPPRRGDYIRPFLCLTRQQTEAYCTALGQRYVTDTTNADLRYARNRIRAQAIPALTAVNPHAVQAMAQMATRMRQMDSWLQEQAHALLARAQTQKSWRRDVLLLAPAPILQTALCLLSQRYGPVQQKTVDLLVVALQKGSGAVQLSKDVVLRVQNGFLTPIRASAVSTALCEQLDPRPAIPGTYRFPGGYTLILQKISTAKYEDFKKNANKDLTSCADYAKIQKSAVLRTRMPGDRYRPAASGVHKTLKKYMNEQHIPVPCRSLLPLLADGSEVLWLWGHGFAKGLEPGAKTREVFCIECRQEPTGTKGGATALGAPFEVEGQGER